MADELERLDSWLEPLMEKLNTGERRKLIRKVAMDMRRSQQERMKNQRNPDGSAWEARLRQSGRKVRQRAMFRKLRLARYLRIKSSPEHFELAFTERSGRIARIHHYGLRAKVNRFGLQHTYASRQLLGLSDADVALIEQSFMEHLGSP